MNSTNTFYVCRHEDQKNSAAELLLSYFEEALRDQGFVIDYQQLFPVEDDIDIIKQSCPQL